MEELLRKQAEIGKDIDKMFTNFKKDSITRKTLEYLDKRLQILEANLSAFNTNHEALIPFEATNSDHPYFKENYALKIQQLFKKFKASIVELQTTQATSSASPAQNMELNFDLDNGKEEKLKEDGSNEQLARLVRRQKSIMNTVEKFLQDILDKPKDSWSLSYCEYKMDMLRKYQIELFNNNQLIWELSTQSEPYEYKADYYIDSENGVQEVMVALQERIYSLNKPFTTNLAFQQAAQPDNSSYIKLPKISLPTFD